MILNALEGKPLPVYGDGQNVRDWLFVEDHCAAIRARAGGGRGRARPTTSAATARRTNLDVVHTHLPRSLDELRPAAATAAARADHASCKDRPGPRPPLRHRRREDPARARLAAARRPSRPGMRRTVRWYLDNRDWVRRGHAAASTSKLDLERNYGSRDERTA